MNYNPNCYHCRNRVPHLASSLKCDGCARFFLKNHEAGRQLTGPYRGRRLCADCIEEFPGATIYMAPLDDDWEEYLAN